MSQASKLKLQNDIFNNILKTTLFGGICDFFHQHLFYLLFSNFTLYRSSNSNFKYTKFQVSFFNNLEAIDRSVTEGTDRRTIKSSHKSSGFTNFDTEI